jgi:hypothetical protein
MDKIKSNKNSIVTLFFFTFRSVSVEFKLDVDRIETVPDSHWDDNIVPVSLLIVAVVFVCYFHIYYKTNRI